MSAAPVHQPRKFLLQRELGRLDGLNQKFVRKNVQVRGSPTFLSFGEKFFIYLSSDGVWVICPIGGPHGNMVKAHQPPSRALLPNGDVIASFLLIMPLW